MRVFNRRRDLVQGVLVHSASPASNGALTQPIQIGRGERRYATPVDVRQRSPASQRPDGGGPVGGEQHRQWLDRARYQQHAGSTELHAPPGVGKPVERFAIAQERPSRPRHRGQPAELKAVGERRGSDHQSSAIVQGMEVATGLNLIRVAILNYWL